MNSIEVLSNIAYLLRADIAYLLRADSEQPVHVRAYAALLEEQVTILAALIRSAGTPPTDPSI